MKEAMLIMHFIGLAMGLGTSFAMMFLGKASAKMEKEEGQKFMLNAMVLSKMGQIGLVLLLISGIYLAYLRWDYVGTNGLFHAKLTLFVVLGGLIGMMSAKAKKAAQGDVEANLAKMRPFGMLALLVALAIVVIAVILFP